MSQNSETNITPSEYGNMEGKLRKRAMEEKNCDPDSKKCKNTYKELDPLIHVFKSLCTVYTFCSTRKHIPVTFNTIKSSVENLIKREFTLNDLFAIKSLIPDLISVEFTNTEQIRLRRDGILNHTDPFEPKFACDSNHNSELLIEFLDIKNDSSAKSKKKNIGGIKDTTRLMKIIERRNRLFHDAVEQFYDRCIKEEREPVDLLRTSIDALLPSFPEILADKDPLEESEIPSTTALEIVFEELLRSELYTNQIVPNGRRFFPCKSAEYGELDSTISEELLEVIKRTRGISRLYSHQAKAICDLKNSNVIVSTATASGKSLVYNLPVLNALLLDPTIRALYIFPTKALAQDQKRCLEELLFDCSNLRNIKIACLDGDTEYSFRRDICDEANIIFTNPDMLHAWFLPNWKRWHSFFLNLKFVILDELHVYTGLFGSHCAMIMRRLIRICSSLGSKDDIRFISCSATITKPLEHMQLLLGIENISLTSIDGSPCGQKQFILWNPPYIDEKNTSLGRRSSIMETSLLLEFLISRGIRTIVFCKVRATCELLLRQIKSNLQSGKNSRLLNRVMSYRAGYTPQDRRMIERKMFKGDLLGIVATSALELGIDLGSLDAVIMLGVPWSISSMWQQSGRAGRRQQMSLTILVADSGSPLDQHYMRNPDDLFQKPHENAGVDTQNSLVLEAHLQCAASEVPITLPSDTQFFGGKLQEICEDKLLRDIDGSYRTHPKFKPYPSKHVAIRNIEEDSFFVIDTEHNKILEEIELSRAVFTVYEGAVFLHQGRAYLVIELNTFGRYAKVRATNVDWRTRPRDYTDVDIVATKQTICLSPIKKAFACYGQIRVTTKVFGYFRIDRNNQILESVDIDITPIEISTFGWWIDVNPSVLEQIRMLDVSTEAAIHAASHILLSLLPSYTGSHSGDVKTECKSPLAKRPRPPRIILYDAQGNGSGIAAKAFDHIKDLLKKAHQVVVSCSCIDGCPKCINIPNCKEFNSMCNKEGARIILDSFVD
ncbi:uncharacterized protein VTP21DRAFT_2380 [Calcarisporiella thermophila]|uniref:uncharacterized protein n=1 Tax=Calcarisporiella thermophila TaxID=911321 RepID=UPI003743FC0C